MAPTSASAHCCLGYSVCHALCDVAAARNLQHHEQAATLNNKDIGDSNYVRVNGLALAPSLGFVGLFLFFLTLFAAFRLALRMYCWRQRRQSERAAAGEARPVTGVAVAAERTSPSPPPDYDQVARRQENEEAEEDPPSYEEAITLIQASTATNNLQE